MTKQRKSKNKIAVGSTEKPRKHPAANKSGGQQLTKERQKEPAPKAEQRTGTHGALSGGSYGAQ